MAAKIRSMEKLGGSCEGGSEAMSTISEKWNEDKLSLGLDRAVGGSCYRL